MVLVGMCCGAGGDMLSSLNMKDHEWEAQSDAAEEEPEFPMHVLPIEDAMRLETLLHTRSCLPRASSCSGSRA